MAAATKRITTTAVKWKELSDKVLPTKKYAAELAALQSEHTHYFNQVLARPADLPKYDFAALKKQMPRHAAILDSLQKQYESIKIPYGEIPAAYLKEIDKWTEYNNLRIKLHEMKAEDGAAEAKKVEEKWAKAPPVEHFTLDHFPEYFPKHYTDFRYQNYVFDPLQVGINETNYLEERFKDYKVLPRPGREEGH